VAGIRAAPPEIGMGESTTLSALLVHTPGPRPELGAIWFACLEAGSARGCLGLDFGGLVGSGDDDDSADGQVDPNDFQFGVGDSFVYAAQGEAIETAWGALSIEDRVEGLSVIVSVTYVQRSNSDLQAMLIELAVAQQGGDGEALEELGAELQSLVEDGIPAARRIIVSEKSLGRPDPVACGDVTGLTPNANPDLLGVTLHFDESGRDSGFPLGGVTFVEPGTDLVLRPRAADGSVEEYLYITTDLETQCRTEAPWYAWLTNAGELGHDYSFTADADDLDEVAGRPKVNELHLPPREDFPDVLTLWVVARDRRGGLDWIEIHFAALDDIP
jgi:hypothetical protein